MPDMHNARPSWERAPATAAVRHDAANRIIVELARLPHDDRVIVGVFVVESAAVALEKHVRPEQHLLRRPPAWCVAELHLERLAALAAQYHLPALVRLIGPAGQRWEASLHDFDAHGFDVARDRDRQRGLPLERWRQHAEGAVQLAFDGLLAAGVEEVAR